MVFGRPTNPELLRRAAELRQHMTPEERMVWQELRGNRLGVHFRRQQPLAPYIASTSIAIKRVWWWKLTAVRIAGSRATTTCAIAI
jgi:very-short-patch-repair endonuclease